MKKTRNSPGEIILSEKEILAKRKPLSKPGKEQLSENGSLNGIRNLKDSLAQLEKQNKLLIFSNNQLERALAESQENFKNIFEKSPVGKAMTSIDGKIMVNQAVCDILGYSTKELLKKNWIEITHPDDIQGDRDVAEQLLGSNNSTIRYEKRYIHKSGDIIWASVTASLERDSKGNPQHFNTIIIDISQQKKSLENLKISEERYRSYIDLTGQIAWVTNSNGEVIEDIPNFRKFTGQTYDQVKGIGWVSALHPDDIDQTLTVWDKAVSLRAPYETEYRVRRYDGVYRNLLARAFPVFNTGGTISEWVGTCIDITERKKAEEEIRDNEKHFRELIEALPQLFWTCRVEGPCDYLSRQWVEFTGIPEAEQLGFRWLEQLHPEDRKRTASEWMEKVKSGESFDVEFRIRRNDGVYHWFKTRAVPMRDSNGNIIKWFGSNTDFNEIKKAEEQYRNFSKELEKEVDDRTKELQKSKKLLDETGRLARVGGWEIDLQDNSLHWSGMTSAIHEIEPGFIPSVESGINFYAPEAIPVISECVDRAIRFGEPFDVELELITAKQNRLWVRAIGEVYREDGEIVKIGGVFQDINKRKLAELDAFRKSEQLQLLSNELEIIIDSIPGLVFYKDINNRFIRVNKYISDSYKMSKKQLEGVNLNELHSKEQAQAYYEDDLEVIRSRKPKINIDESWVTGSGTKWVSTSKIPYINEKDEVIGVIGVSLDVTERKLAEEELGKYREHLEELVTNRTAELADAIRNLERSNQELEQFAYVASHDLQEPLRMVSSFTQMLERRYKDKIDADANDFIHYAVDGANRMQKLINDLLDFSRITTRGKDFTKVDLSQLLGQAISNLQQLISDNSALVSNDDLPEMNVDESQIIRVFQNLIENAIKYRKSTELPKVHISCKNQNKFYEFAIRDNGIGIDMQFHDRIFIIFQRLHSKEEYPGTGIGLSICKRIVERHGGSLWFNSVVNEGTTFYFTLNK